MDGNPIRLILDGTVIENNRGRMDYPRYRRLGLPIPAEMNGQSLIVE